MKEIVNAFHNAGIDWFVISLFGGVFLGFTVVAYATDIAEFIDKRKRKG